MIRAHLRTFGRLLGYARPERARIAGVFALALAGGAVELARPWPVKLVVDHVLAHRPAPPWLHALGVALPGSSTPTAMLAWCVAGAVLITLGSAALSVLVLDRVMAVAQRMVFDLSRDLLARLQRLSLAYHGRNTVGDLLQRVSADTFVVHFAFSQVLLPGTVSLLTLAGMFVIMARIDGSLTVVALLVVPALVGALAVFARHIDRANTRQWAAQSALMALTEQSLSAIKVIQGFAREPYIQAKLDGRARELGAAYTGATRVSSVFAQTTTATTALAAATLLWLGGKRVLAGTMTVGELWLFLGYLGALSGPVNGLATAVGAAFVTVTRGRRVFEVLDAVEEVAERPAARSLGRARGEVVLEDVHFGYTGADGARGRAVLRGVTLHAHPGQITAIVGATGVGKSSLVALLSRFYDPWQGRVLVDGYDVRDVELRSLRENVSLVLQEPFLFPMSVAENITFGSPGATRAEVEDAARRAQAHEFIERLPAGYDTVLGEKAVTLSGGERQRIAIARAMLKDAPILVLDEPTSALDAHTESRIVEALAELMRGRTTFIISHRLSTIRQADQILAIQDGRIVERGTHDRLLEQGEVYSRLYRHQHIAVL